jgi:hypothetical protein
MIRFPTDGSTVPIGLVNFHEMPDPLTSCPNYRSPVGLPITLQLGSGYRGHMTSFSLQGPNGAVETCGFDWTNYQNSDPAIRAWARKGMKFFGGIILIPKSPLADGHYTVNISTDRENATWSFDVANPRPTSTPSHNE